MKFFTNGRAFMFSGSKYGNTTVEVDGHKFDSKKEANRYVELKYLEMAGEIKDLTVQPKFELVPAFTDVTGERHRQVCYIADFLYIDKNKKKTIIEDVKGMKTEVYKIKKKMFMHKYFMFGGHNDKEFVELT